mgnify:CR=1 FL=1
MAVGDIKQFGLWKMEYHYSKDGWKINYYGTDDNVWVGDIDSYMLQFRGARIRTLVDSNASNKIKPIRWVESNLDGRTAYISKNIALNLIAVEDIIELCSKTITIDSVDYNLAFLTQSQLYNIPSDVCSKLQYNSDEYYYYCSDSYNGNYKTVSFNQTNFLDSNKNVSVDYYDNRYLYIPVLVFPNTPPTISGEDSNLGNKTSNFSITYSVNDNDVADELTVNEKLNGDIIRTLKNPVKGKELTLTISEERFANLSVNSTNTIEIEVTDGQATTYRRYTFVKTNSAPFITYTGQADLGELTTKPSITYSVKDNEGDAITVTEKLNGEVINQFSATTNTNYTVGITDTFWLTCGSNTNTVEIIASDALGGSSSKTITFSRKITKLQIVMKNAIETDAKATKILVSPQWTTTGGVGKVEVCNNGFDSNPTWEDATTMVVLNRPYLFSNSSKTASKWGIKIRITVTKNQGYDGEVAIFGFGGAYE